jgi:hypothetical protein
MTETTLSNAHTFIPLSAADRAVWQAKHHLSYLVLGPPGIGKTGRFSKGAEERGYGFLHIDAPVTDPYDIGMLAPDVEAQVAREWPSARYKALGERKHLVLIDEITKASPPTLNALHGALYGYPRRIGHIELHPETIVVCTGNLNMDGVGDQLKAHTDNRVVNLYVRPTFEDFWEYGLTAPNCIGTSGFHSTIMIMARQVKRLWELYLDPNTENNTMIFNPKKGRTTNFWSPRSAEMASTILYSFEQDMKDSEVTPGSEEELEHKNILWTQLAGCVGGSVMEHIRTYYELNDQIPMNEDILRDPENCKVPTDPAAQGFIINNALSWVEADSVDGFLRYLTRLPKAEQECFWELAKVKWQDDTARFDALVTHKIAQEITLNSGGSLKASVGSAKDRI